MHDDERTPVGNSTAANANRRREGCLNAAVFIQNIAFRTHHPLAVTHGQLSRLLDLWARRTLSSTVNSHDPMHLLLVEPRPTELFLGGFPRIEQN